MGKQTSVYLDDEVVKSIEEIAEEEDRTFNYTLNRLLKEVISGNIYTKKKHKREKKR